MKNYQRLKGMVAATFTPFNTDGELNLPIIPSMLTRWQHHRWLVYLYAELQANHCH